MAFKLPELDYAYNALEPYIDEDTMKIHHTKHHQAYLNNLNKIIEGTEWENYEIDYIIANIDKLPQNIRTGVRNNGGGYYNHMLFWKFMTPDSAKKPSGELLEKIEETFGSFEEFQKKFEEAGAGQFGSGWAWLVLDGKNLQIVKTSNQDNPLTDGKKPILCVDVWEHAYYLKYQNKRGDYLKSFWNVVNWKEVERKYKEKVADRKSVV